MFSLSTMDRNASKAHLVAEILISHTDRSCRGERTVQHCSYSLRQVEGKIKTIHFVITCHLTTAG